MRLDDHRVAGGEAREHAGIGVPRREGGAADRHGDAARHDAPLLVHTQRLRPRPAAFPSAPLAGTLVISAIGVGNSLQRAVLRVRPTRLERHHERLAGCVLHGVGDGEALLVEAMNDLEAYAGARLDAGRRPAGACRPRRRHELIDGSRRIGDAERKAPRALLLAEALAARMSISNGLPICALNAASASTFAVSP